jgi:Raf kinase inhibitor-like YbhB/YbcL family protein
MKLLISVLLMISSISHASEFSVSSPSISPNSTLSLMHVFNGFGCQGKNLSPELNWTNAPKDTQSFALTVYDPDAPTGSGWWHWLVYNLPANVTHLAAGAGTSAGNLLPSAAKQGRNDFGSYDFGGACPPVGNPAHRYILTLYALNTATLKIPADASAAMIGFMIQSHQLAKTQLTAKYSR